MDFDADLVAFTMVDEKDYDQDGDDEESIQCYRLTEHRTSKVYIFTGLGTEVAYAYRGKLVEETTRHLIDGDQSGMLYTYNGSGRLRQITTAQGQEYNIVFDTNSGPLASIVVKKPDNTIIAQVEYTYRTTAHSSDVGPNGELIQVKVSEADSDDVLSRVRYTQYRYDSGKRLKAVYSDEAIRRVIADDASATTPAVNPEDLLSWPDSKQTAGTKTGAATALPAFADKRFTYHLTAENTAAASTALGTENLEDRYGGVNVNEQFLVKSEIIGAGGCTSCSGVSGVGTTLEYHYMQLNGGTSSDWNTAVWLVVEDRKDANGNLVSRCVTSQNDEGRTLRTATILNPGAGTPQYWCTSRKFDAIKPGRVSQLRSVSAHNDKVLAPGDLKNFLNPSSGSNDQNTLDDEGVIRSYEYDDTGRVQAVRIQNGKSDTTPSYLSYTVHGDDTTNKPDWLPVETRDYATKVTSASSNPITTTYDYTFWDGSGGVYTKIKTRTTTLPAIPTTQNGSGMETVIEEYWDEEGRLRWVKDGEGYVHYRSYHPVTGGLALVVTDVGSSMPSEITTSGSGAWVAWSSGSPPFTRGTSLPSGLNLVTKQEYDDLGRRTMTTDADGGRRHVRYEANRVLTYRYVDASSGVPVLPVDVVEYAGKQATQRYRVLASKATGSSGVPTGLNSPAQSDYVSWSRWNYAPLTGQQSSYDRYHDIPSPTAGAVGTNFYRTHLLYTSRGQLGAIAQFVETGKYQVAAYVYDKLDRIVESRVGVTTAAPSSGTYGYDALDDAITSAPAVLASPTDFSGWTVLSERTYDNGGVGDSRMTSFNRHHTDSDYTKFNVFHNWRGFLRAVERRANGSTVVKPHQVQDVDWKGRVVASGILKNTISNFNTTVVAAEDYAAESGGRYGIADRLNLAVQYYDSHGNLYRTDFRPASYNVYQRTDRYYDRRGDLVGVGDPHAAFVEYAYDGAGRRYQTRVLAGPPSSPFGGGNAYVYANPTPKPAFSQLSGSNADLIELSHVDYGTGLVALASHRVERDHDSGATPAFSSGTPSDAVRATRHYYYNAANQLTTVVDYGSGASTWIASSLPSRAGSPPTSSTSNYLVSRFAYDTTGRRDTTIDPKQLAGGGDRITRTFYDDLNRTRYVVENHQSSYNPFSGPPSGAADVNRTFGVVLNGFGAVSELKAYNSGASPSMQTTRYWYGSNYNASLVTEIALPDSTSTPGSGADLIQLAYNRDGSRLARTDQRGVKISYQYDSARRVLLQSAEVVSGTLASLGVDDGVEAIGRTYDDFGRVTHVTSHAGTTSGSTALNQVKYIYDANLGRLSTAEQNHSTTVGAGTPATTYSYDADSVNDSPTGRNLFINGVRPLRTVLPVVSSSGWVQYDYGSPDSLSDRLHREASRALEDGDLRSGSHTHTVRNSYNGVGRVVETSSDSVSATLAYFAAAGNYDALDRWGRVTRQEWKLGGTPIDRFDYVYDEASNRTSRAVTGKPDLSQTYDHDELHRLESVNESLGTTHDQSWDLDQLGNWESFTKGGATETRLHNAANELTLYSAGATPTHDKAGNMTTIPKPKALANGFAAKYDAWNRLTQLDGGSSASYQYDGLGRRIVRTEGADTTHFYYNEEWQVLTETNGAGAATAIYLYHPHYVDAVAVRMTSATHPAVDKEHFYTHDALFSVTSAIVNSTTDAVVERYAYSPYGEARVMDDLYNSVGSSPIANEKLSTGRRVDPGTGLQVNRFRMYHQQLGRWLTRDPAGYIGGNNLFEYVKSRVTKLLDPTGLQDLDFQHFPLNERPQCPQPYQPYNEPPFDPLDPDGDGSPLTGGSPPIDITPYLNPPQPAGPPRFPKFPLPGGGVGNIKISGSSLGGTLTYGSTQPRETYPSEPGYGPSEGRPGKPGDLLDAAKAAYPQETQDIKDTLDDIRDNLEDLFRDPDGCP